MSFLLQDDDEDDQQATLAVALAFIDSCDESSSSSSSSTSTTSINSSSPNSSTRSESRSTDDDDDGDGDGNSQSAAPDAEKRASLRVVIRTTANKKLTAAATTPAGNQKQVDTPTKAQQVAPTRVPAAAAPHDRAARNGSAVTRHRARKKAEFASLRTELVELEATLAHLQRANSMRDAALLKRAYRPNQNRSSSSSGDDDMTALSQVDTLTTEATDGSLWMEIAAMQAKERFKSEELNQKLKDAVAKQKKISKALETILGIKGKTSAPMQYGFDLLSDIQKQGLYNESMLSMESMVLAGLQASVAQMYQSMDTVFDNATIAATATNGLDMVSHSTQMKKDPETGDQYVELRTTTSLPFEFLEAVHLIGQVFAMMRPQSYPGYSMQKRDITDSSFEKRYTLMLDTPSGGAVELRGVSFVQRFVQERHVVYVFASAITTPHGLAFREKGWVALFRSSGDNLLFPSVMQSCLQVSNEPCTASSSKSKSSAFDSDTAKRENVLREFILAMLVSRTRYQYQTIQNFMLESAQHVQMKRDPVLALQALSC